MALPHLDREGNVLLLRQLQQNILRQEAVQFVQRWQPAQLLASNRTVAGYSISGLLRTAPHIVAATACRVLALLASGQLRADAISILPLAQAAEAHRLIEEAMLAANVCTADMIQRSKHPALYRVHEGPTPEKKTTLQNYLKSLGLGLSISDEPTPAEYQAIAQSTKDRPDAQQIHSMLLRSMQQAIYTPANSGHFGLAYEAYTHFTSPIRRYPDLLVHRVIKALITEGKNRYVLQMELDLPKGKKSKALEEKAAWESAGDHCSACERRADEASRDVEAWLKCRYMREHLGEEFAGTVSAVTTFGLFVQLDSLYVEGLIHVTELGGEYFRFDELRQELRGERTGIRYSTGSRVRVQVSRVDLDGRKIDFRMVRDRGDDMPVSRNSRDRKPIAKTPQEKLKTVRDTDRQVKAQMKSSRKGGDKKVAKSSGKSRAANGRSSTTDQAAKSRKSSR